MREKLLGRRQAAVLRCARGRGGIQDRVRGKELMLYTGASHNALKSLCDRQLLIRFTDKSFPREYGQVWYQMTAAGVKALERHEAGRLS